MKKNEIINAITTNNGTMNEKTGNYEMSTENYNNFLFDVDGVKINDVDKKTHCIKIGKSVITIIEKNGKQKNKNNVTGGHGVKSKNATYIIVIKNFDDKTPKTINNITCCADIKLWLKTLERKNIEYLRIYDMLNNPCRLSAWIEHETETNNK